MPFLHLGFGVTLPLSFGMAASPESAGSINARYSYRFAGSGGHQPAVWSPVLHGRYRELQRRPRAMSKQISKQSHARRNRASDLYPRKKPRAFKVFSCTVDGGTCIFGGHLDVDHCFGGCSLLAACRAGSSGIRSRTVKGEVQIPLLSRASAERTVLVYGVLICRIALQCPRYISVQLLFSVKPDHEGGAALKVLTAKNHP